MIDRGKFFDGVRQSPFPKRLLVGQVTGMNAILDEWERRDLADLRWLGYMLGTVYWECDKTMQPISEAGSLKYLKSKKYYPWIGRGFVQLTWQRNYITMQAHLKAAGFDVDIVATPDDAKRMDVAAFIMFEGMIGGIFTSKRLMDYFSATITDWVNARRIINGTDKAAIIAGFAKQFYADLTAAT